MTVKTIKNTKDLSRLLKARREELEISQAELAQLCNLSLNGISKLESNKDGTREIKLSTIFKLSKFLGFELAIKVEE